MRKSALVLLAAVAVGCGSAGDDLGSESANATDRTIAVYTDEVGDALRITIDGESVKALSCDTDQDGVCSFELRGQDIQPSVEHVERSGGFEATLTKLNQYKAAIVTEEMLGGPSSDICRQVIDMTVGGTADVWLPEDGFAQCMTRLVEPDDPEAGYFAVYSARLKLRLAEAPVTDTRLELISNGGDRYTLEGGAVTEKASLVFLNQEVQGLCFAGEPTEVEPILEEVAVVAAAGDDECAPGNLRLKYHADTDRFTGTIFWEDIYSGFFDSLYEIDFGRCQ